MQVRWTGKKAYSFYGINVFVIAISLMNWVFFCLEAYACQGSSTPLLPLSPSPLCLYPTGNEQVTKNKRVKTISISFGGRDRGRLVLLQVNRPSGTLFCRLWTTKQRHVPVLQQHSLWFSTSLHDVLKDLKLWKKKCSCFSTKFNSNANSVV